MTTVGISIITAAVTAVLAVAGTYLTTRRDLQLKFDESLRDLRIGAYKELWEHLGKLAKYGRPETLSKSQAQTLRDSLRTWYFHTGGLVLSSSTRQDYFTMLDGLELVIGRHENIVSDKDDEFLRVLGSRLRTAMTRDVGTRRTFIFRGDPEREEPRLHKRTYLEDGGTRTLGISPKRRLNLAHLIKFPPKVITSGKPDLTMTNTKLLRWDWDPARRALTVHVAAGPDDGDAEERLFLLEDKDRCIVEGPKGWSRGEAVRHAQSVIWREYDRTPAKGEIAMAPERPRSLVILDLSEPGAQDGGTVYHWDPVNADMELVVLWEAARCPGGFVDTVANVACVAVPPGYTEYRYALERPREPLVESWRGQPRGSILMVIAILPPGYAFDGPEGCDWPVKAKIVGERLATYWIFAGNETVEPAWRIAPVEDVAPLVECAATINHRPSPPELPEPPVPSTAELHEWAERRSDPVEGRPDADS